MAYNRKARRLLSRLPRFARKHQLANIPTGPNDPAEDDYSSEHVEVEDIESADIVLSHEPSTNLHRPILDIDFPVSVIPSSTPGHHHLYIDKPMPWLQYKVLLRALEEAEIIEPGYANVSIARGYTSVRLPWVKKRNKKEGK